MGRPRKGTPKDIPPDLSELTDKQADLLAWIYEADESRKITWSAKAYLGRSPTRSEAATLSGRIKSLVGHGALARTGRAVELTPNGRMLLYAYAMKNRNTMRMEKLSIRLESHRIKEDIEILLDVQLISFRHLGPGDETMALVEALSPLRDAIGKSWDKLIERLDELKKSTREN